MAKWYVKRNEKQAGPFETAQVRHLAQGKKIRPHDLIRRADQEVWHRADSVKGLFPTLTPEEPKVQENETSAQSSSDHPTTQAVNFETKASFRHSPKSVVCSLWIAMKRTGLIATKKTEIAKIEQFSLPAAYQALGEAFYNKHVDDLNSDAIILEISSIKSEKSREKERLLRLPKGTLVEKAKFVPRQIVCIAKEAIANRKIHKCYRTIGGSVYARNYIETDLSTYKEKIQSLLKRVADLLIELEVLRATSTNQSVRGREAKRTNVHIGAIGAKKPILKRKTALVFATACFFFIIVSAAFRQLGEINDWVSSAVAQRKDTENGGRTDEAPQHKIPDEVKQQKQSDEVTQHKLPEEITKHSKRPELTLTSIPFELHKKSSRNVSEPFISPKGKFIAFFEGENKALNMRLWNSENGKEATADSKECDYFSFPATFSPDETRLTCLDGEFLRVWDVKTTQARLVQSIKLPKLSHQDDTWNTIRWGKEDTIIIGVRPVTHKSFTYLRLRQTDAAFSIDGTERVSPKSYKGADIRFNNLVVSPDGNTAALAFRDNERGKLTIQITDFKSGKEIREISLPGSTQEALIRFPQISTLVKNVPDVEFYSGDCLGYSPDGRFLLVSFSNAHVDATDKTKQLRVISTRDWEQSVNLDLKDLASGAKGRETFVGEYEYRFHCFSPDGNSVAGIAIQETSTSRGTKVKRKAVVHDLSTGKRTAEIDLGDEFDTVKGRHLSTFNYRVAGEKLTFSPDGNNLVIAVSNDLGWSEKNRRPESSWSVGEWNISDSGRVFALSGITMNVSSITLTPDGKCLFLGTSQVLDIPLLAKLKAVLDEGDKLWDQGNHSDALKSYCFALNDERASLIYGNMDRAWSRCVDAFAEDNKVTKSKALVLHMQESNMSIEPESMQGKKVVSELLAEQQAAKLRSAELAREAAETQLKELRAKNQSNRVIAAALTKKEFVNRLRSTATRGRIEVSAIFESYAFQDVFGDPDSNVDWVDGKRLYLYRCVDGAVQLEVMVLDSRVFLSGISEF